MKRMTGLIAILSMCLLTSCGQEVCGKYVSEATERNYYEFLDSNKIVAGQWGVTLEGEYEILDDLVNLEFALEYLGAEIPLQYALRILDDGTLLDTSIGVEIVYSK